MVSRFEALSYALNFLFLFVLHAAFNSLIILLICP